MKFIKKHILKEGYFNTPEEMRKKAERNNNLSAAERVANIAQSAEKEKIKNLIDYVLKKVADNENENFPRGLSLTNKFFLSKMFGADLDSIFEIRETNGVKRMSKFVYDIDYDIDVANKTITFTPVVNRITVYDGSKTTYLSELDYGSDNCLTIRFCFGAAAFSKLETWMLHLDWWSPISLEIDFSNHLLGCRPWLDKESKEYLNEIVKFYKLKVNKINIKVGAAHSICFDATKVGNFIMDYSFDKDEAENLKTFVSSVFSFEHCNDAYIVCNSEEGNEDEQTLPGYKKPGLNIINLK